MAEEMRRSLGLRWDPDNGANVLDHGLELANALATADPDFRCVIQVRTDEGVPAAVFEAPPVIEATLTADDGRETTLAFFPNPHAEPLSGSWEFSDDEAGREAHRKVHLARAMGKSVQLVEGMRVRLSRMPTLLRPLLDEGASAEGWSLGLPSPKKHQDVTIEVRDPDHPLRLSLPVYDTLPNPGDESAYVGLVSGVLSYIGVRRRTASRAELRVELSHEPQGSAARGMAAVQLLQRMISHPLRLESPLVGGTATVNLRSGNHQPDEPFLRWLLEIYSCVLAIEEALDVHLRVPDSPTFAELEELAAINQLVRDRESSLMVSFRAELQPPSAQDAMQMALALPVRREVVAQLSFSIWGTALNLGWAHMSFESVRVGVAAHRPGLMELDAGGRTSVRLVDAPSEHDIVLSPSASQPADIRLAPGLAQQ